MTGKIQINAPLNRVEGDLEIRVEIEDGIVIDARSSGTMFRGFENILAGRGVLDSLVITPRICGICTTAHLTAACLALEMIAGVQPPPDAIRMRNLALMVETIQSDMRHGFLMFAADFTNPCYKGNPLYEEALHRYRLLCGQTVIDVIRETKKVLGIISIIGGQWPHSAYMVPGGIVSVPSSGDLVQCRFLLRQYRHWYENRVLGCSIERWQAVESASDLESWMAEKDAHREGELGFFIRFARSAGLDRIGRGPENFISYGAFDIPEGSTVKPLSGDGRFIPAGFARKTEISPFDPGSIAEDTAYSWYMNGNGDSSCHPAESRTLPYASGDEAGKYSWAKAPRYKGLPAETGPLAEMIIAGRRLFTDYIDKNGTNVFIRELARLTRPALLIPAMDDWISETTEDGQFYKHVKDIEHGDGFGITNVTRGALGHWVKIRDGVIDHYQIIPPTTWNGSPRDSKGIRGPWEEALVGTPVADPEDPVELGHVVRSFDACLVCAVHAIDIKGHSGTGSDC